MNQTAMEAEQDSTVSSDFSPDYSDSEIPTREQMAYARRSMNDPVRVIYMLDADKKLYSRYKLNVLKLLGFLSTAFKNKRLGIKIGCTSYSRTNFQQ
ncbi:unnamed protein product [Notodromas monacha]|uniref:Uncharacterized protein n=1 Tax=Notodromas monacha TaxID=399045 RepID=A0A7R9BUS5_9CRUS|nr:unnamed protein product [Notodromas monacha]CAG0921169.1 unnamed protein product [Notodromas monacha]